MERANGCPLANDLCLLAFEDHLDVFQGDHLDKDWFETFLFDGFTIGGSFILTKAG